MTEPGEHRRREILDAALDLAGRIGLASVTFGNLAEESGVSKSGIAGLFGTKSELQLAVIDRARSEFIERVLSRATGEHGLVRLQSLLDAWIDHLDHRRHGCFFSAAALEWDGRPGPQRDAIATVTTLGLDALLEQITLARRLGQVAADSDDVQLAFELHSPIVEANLVRQLLGDNQAFERARRAIETRLSAAAVSADR